MRIRLLLVVIYVMRGEDEEVDADGRGRMACLERSDVLYFIFVRVVSAYTDEKCHFDDLHEARTFRSGFLSSCRITACMLPDRTSLRERQSPSSHVKRCMQPNRVACVYTVH